MSTTRIKLHQILISALASLSISTNTLAETPAATATQPKEATAATQQHNADVLKQLPFNDRQDFTDAQRGFIATTPHLTIRDAAGHSIWDLTAYEFLKNPAPNTVNPSLWRQSQLNMNNGLFKVTDKIYQIRSFDLSNMTIIEGNTGLILIDPLVSPETAKAGLDLYYQNRPKIPVVAIIYTHSHVDHYGGVKGVTTIEDVSAGKVKIIAPEGFLEEAVSENVYAGTAMGRRALYHTGAILTKSEKGQVDSGLGKTTSLGSSTLIPPTVSIKTTGETLNVDGIKMEFLMAPGTEAPAEMLIYFPQFHLLNAAEDATRNLHNLYTLRGAPVRDAKSWWKTLNEAINRYGSRTDIVIAQHQWPTWDNERVISFLENQRDLYKFIHDQSLNLANQGYTPIEIGEMITLPKNLANKWYNRGYYGSINHNAKAVYQRYLGWYDSNPAHLYPLPPAQSAKHYVEFMGGAEAVIVKAKQSYAKGEYRWVAEVMNQVVFSEPNNKAARELQADALEQLGYQTENATWRNNFLMGAFELRKGVPKVDFVGVATPDVVEAMSPEMLLDYMGIRLDRQKSDGKTMNIIWKQPGTSETYAIELRNSVLIYSKNKSLKNVDATLTLSAHELAKVLMGGSTLDKELKDGNAKIEGDPNKIKSLFSMLDTFHLMFNVVTPNPM